MKIIFLSLWLCVFSTCTFAQDATDFDSQDLALFKGRLLQRQIEKGKLPEKLDKTIEQMIKTATWQLSQHNELTLAAQIQQDFETNYYGYVQAHFTTDGLRIHGIGDHPEYILSKWLDDVYNKVQSVLGYELMRVFHLTDIKTINWGLRVVLDPCNPEWNIEEYRRHFAGGSNKEGEFYDGVLPVISYWTSMLVCEVATWGSGWFLVCSPVSQLVEMGVEKYIAPKLSDAIYIKTCQ